MRNVSGDARILSAEGADGTLIYTKLGYLRNNDYTFGEKHMKYFVLDNLGLGLVCMMVFGCSNSELGTSPESQLTGEDTPLESHAVVEAQQALAGETLTTYLKGVDDKLGQLKDKHAKLVDHVQKDGSGTEPTLALNAILGELKKKGEELQFQIEAMKSAKGEDQLALQTGMDKALADLAQSYDDALAQFAG
jgi:hypothetical protein